MLVVWVHLLNWPLMMISAAIALFSQDSRTSKNWHMVTRITYLIAVLSGLFLLIFAMHSQPYLAIIKSVLALLVMASLEMAFAKKKAGQLNAWRLYLTLGALILLGLFGWVLMH